jgi:hypothetical protein
MSQQVVFSVNHSPTGIQLNVQAKAESRAAAVETFAGLLANPSDWRLLAEPVGTELLGIWRGLMPGYVPTRGQWRVWMQKYGPSTMREAIEITAERMKKNIQDGIDFSMLDLVKYASAVMRNIHADNGG